MASYPSCSESFFVIGSESSRISSIEVIATLASTPRFIDALRSSVFLVNARVSVAITSFFLNLSPTFTFGTNSTSTYMPSEEFLRITGFESNESCEPSLYSII